MISKQTNGPMVPFLCDDLCQVIKSLMRRFVKKDVLNAASDEKLTKLDVTDSKNHVDYKRVDVGFASEKLKGTAAGKPSEREVMDFEMKRKACLVAILKKLLEKCPVSYSLVRYLSCFNLVNMASKRDICSAKFRKVLSLLVNVFRVAEKDCDTLREFDLFLDNIPVFGSTQFANFDSSHDRLDSLLYKFMIGDAYKNLPV